MASLLSDRFTQALVYATGLHAEQLRKGSGVPYLSHLLAVTAIVMEEGGDENSCIAALLHDAVEDQGGQKTLAEIEVMFGREVAEIVAGCTDSWHSPKPPWRQRKENYLLNLPEKSTQILLVSLADKLHNARCILADCRSHGEDLWSRFQVGKEEVLWYYTSLVACFNQLGIHPRLAAEFERTVVVMTKIALAFAKQ